jgi:lipoprotein-anchoring transpeptidase ErfK/SrfK
MKWLVASLIAIGSPATAEINLTVDHSDRTISVYDDDRLLDVYPVAMGKPGTYVPYGEYQITTIDVNPSWRGTRGQGFVPSGPRSPLGRIRMRFDGYYALHGTIRPDQIGQYVSLGCIRMHNDDVIDLAKLILLDTESWKGESWYNAMLKHNTIMYHIPLKTPVKIRVVE